MSRKQRNKKSKVKSVSVKGNIMGNEKESTIDSNDSNDKVEQKKEKKVEYNDDIESGDESDEEAVGDDVLLNIDEVEKEANNSDDNHDNDDGSSGSDEDSCRDEKEKEDNQMQESDESEEDTDDEDISNDEKRELPTQSIDEKEQCTFDLRNLLVMNGHQINLKSIYGRDNQNKNDTKNKKEDKDNEEDPSCCIPLNGATTKKSAPFHHFAANEDFLLKQASESCQQLIEELWVLPTERTDVGPLISLPQAFEVPLPRQLPPPAPKAETKWEKFAKERGIEPKSKRSRKVFDEATDSWKYLTGYEKANQKEWPIMEVKRGDDPYMDPWEKERDAKRTKLDKQTENRMRNQERAGHLPKGTTTRFMKDKRAAFERGKEGHKKGNAIPSGIPIDLRPGRKADIMVSKNGASGVDTTMKRGDILTKKALIATQRSTASLGKFDQMREGEPEKKNPIRKRKFEPVTDKKVISSEAERGMKVLERVVNGGKQKDRDVRKGKFAKGETAYDYDYNDGLGASSFKKKKGRAGAGKMKKLTKKRAK